MMNLEGGRGMFMPLQRRSLDLNFVEVKGFRQLDVMVVDFSHICV